MSTNFHPWLLAGRPVQYLRVLRSATARSIWWVPAGFAAAALLGNALSVPVYLLVPALAVLAVVHGATWSVFAVVVGGSALFANLVQATHTAADAGAAYPLLLAGYGGIMSTSILVTVIGDDQRRNPTRSLREVAARYLISGVVAVELALFTLSPLGNAAVGVPHPVGAVALFSAILFAVTVSAIRYDTAFCTAAAMLLVVLLLDAIVAGPDSSSSLPVLAGTVLFAQVAALLTPRPGWDQGFASFGGRRMAGTEHDQLS